MSADQPSGGMRNNDHRPGAPDKYWVLPDNEYRIWVRDTISNRLAARVIGALGVTTLVGFAGLYLAVTDRLDKSISSKYEDQAELTSSQLKAQTASMQSTITESIKSDLDEDLDGLGLMIQSGIIDVLVNKRPLVEEATAGLRRQAETEVIKFLNDPEGKRGILKLIEDNDVVETAILERAVAVAEGNGEALDLAQRAQALQLSLVFQANQTRNRSLLTAILNEEDENQTLGESPLIARVLESYPFSTDEIPTGEDSRHDSAAIEATLRQLSEARDPPQDQTASTYGQFLIRIPPRHLIKLSDWLRENSVSPAADLVAQALLVRGDSEGIPQLVSLLGGRSDVTTRALVVRTLARLDPSASIQEELRRGAFRALWALRTDTKLNGALQNSTSYSAPNIAYREIDMGTRMYPDYLQIPSLIDVALFRTLRADDENTDFTNFLAPHIIQVIVNADKENRSYILDLWGRRIAYDKTRNNKVERTASRTLDYLVGSDQLEELTSEDITFIQFLVTNADAVRIRDFVRGYGQLFDSVSDSLSTPDVLASGIRKDAELDPPYEGTLALWEGSDRWSAALTEQYTHALVQAAGVTADDITAQVLLDAAKVRLDGSSSAADNVIAALLTRAAIRVSDTRALRAAVYRTGYLGSLLLNKSDERLRSVAERLKSDIQLPNCGDRPSDHSGLAPNGEAEIRVNTGSSVRVRLPSRGRLEVSVQTTGGNQPFDLFVWDAACTIAEFQLNEDLQIIDNVTGSEERVFQLVSEGKTGSAILNLRHGPEELIADSQAQQLTLGKSYEAALLPAGVSDPAERSFAPTVRLNAGEIVWLTTSDLKDDDVDTIITATAPSGARAVSAYSGSYPAALK